VIHFDHETRDPEGRYLPDEIVQKPANDRQVAWAVTAVTNPDGALLRALSFSAWIKPRAIADSMLLDVGYSSPDADRVSLLIETSAQGTTDLVLRVLDGLGNHLDTQFIESSELRYEIAQGTGPGIPIDRWTHVDVDVRAPACFCWGARRGRPPPAARGPIRCRCSSTGSRTEYARRG
jgi:hypothetical protein